MNNLMRNEGEGSAAKAKNSSVTKVNSGKRLSVSLSDDAANLLEFLAQSQGITQNEALRKAIATEAYLLEERTQGTKVLLQKPDKEIREVLFR
jgi:Ribbon-helix-helix protein, copG family